MNSIKINDKISFIPASNNPLSADIGIITDKEKWLFDVGCGENNIEQLNDKYNVVISHFHKDHLDNIKYININNLYVSKETYKHLPADVINRCNVIIVDSTIELGSLKIFNVPSSHSKGCLALEIDNEYTFMADAIYASFKNNKITYNAQLLKEEIELLKSIESKYLLISHYEGLVRSKINVIDELEEIYLKRSKNSPEIIINR